jgi:hypothetical protein
MTAFFGKKTSFNAEVGTRNLKLQLQLASRGFDHVTICMVIPHNLVLLIYIII